MHIYDQQIAQHYAAYRPPLHELIVGEVLNGKQFATGLDVGCGTGCSARALAAHCEQVVGVDHSEQMLDMAKEDPRVQYLHGSGDALPVCDNSIEVATFAGVISYLDKEKTLGELRRVCGTGAFVFPYDFEVELSELMNQLSLPKGEDKSAYSHSENFSGHSNVVTLMQDSRSVELSVSEEQAAHILLSDKSRYELLASRFGTTEPARDVVKNLRRDGWSGALVATTYYALHQLEA